MGRHQETLFIRRNETGRVVLQVTFQLEGSTAIRFLDMLDGLTNESASTLAQTLIEDVLTTTTDPAE